jgi:hypothetical protein
MIDVHLHDVYVNFKYFILYLNKSYGEHHLPAELEKLPSVCVCSVSALEKWINTHVIINFPKYKQKKKDGLNYIIKIGIFCFKRTPWLLFVYIEGWHLLPQKSIKGAFYLSDIIAPRTLTPLFQFRFNFIAIPLIWI